MTRTYIVGQLMLVVVIAIVILVAAAIPPEREPRPVREVPACEEDASLVGTGSFVDGRWSAYTCGPSVDDFIPASGNAYQDCLVFVNQRNIATEVCEPLMSATPR